MHLVDNAFHSISDVHKKTRFLSGSMIADFNPIMLEYLFHELTSGQLYWLALVINRLAAVSRSN